MKIKVVFHKEDEGGFWVEVPSLPGCLSQGDTLEEAKKNIKDAIELWFKVTEDKIEEQADSEIVELEI
jgi:predicted RNase H-like HicB family nuclease